MWCNNKRIQVDNYYWWNESEQWKQGHTSEIERECVSVFVNEHETHLKV